MVDVDSCPLPDFTKQARVKELLGVSRKYAIVGMSPRRERPSNEVGLYLRDSGSVIYPVHPRAEQIEGIKAYSSLAALPETVDIVDVFVSAARQGNIAERAHEHGASVIWFQPGAENPEQEERARQLGLEVHSGTCTMAEHRRMKHLGII